MPGGILGLLNLSKVTQVPGGWPKPAAPAGEGSEGADVLLDGQSQLFSSVLSSSSYHRGFIFWIDWKRKQVQEGFLAGWQMAQSRQDPVPTGCSSKWERQDKRAICRRRPVHQCASAGLRGVSPETDFSTLDAGTSPTDRFPHPSWIDGLTGCLISMYPLDSSAGSTGPIPGVERVSFQMQAGKASSICKDEGRAICYREVREAL